MSNIKVQALKGIIMARNEPYRKRETVLRDEFYSAVCKSVRCNTVFSMPLR